MSEKQNDLEQKALVLPSQVEKKLTEIKNQDDLDVAHKAITYIKDVRKQIKETFDPIVDKARATWKEALAQRDKIEAPVKEAEIYVKRLIGDYVIQQEKAQKEARIKEEERQEAIRIAKIKSLQAVADAEQSGDFEKADEILEAEDFVETKEADIVIPEVPKMKGVSFREVWLWEKIDFSKIPREYLMINEVLVNHMVRASKSETNIPGIRVYSDKVVLARGSKQ